MAHSSLPDISYDRNRNRGGVWHRCIGDRHLCARMVVSVQAHSLSSSCGGGCQQASEHCSVWSSRTLRRSSTLGTWTSARITKPLAKQSERSGGAARRRSKSIRLCTDLVHSSFFSNNATCSLLLPFSVDFYEIRARAASTSVKAHTSRCGSTPQMRMQRSHLARSLAQGSNSDDTVRVGIGLASMHRYRYGGTTSNKAWAGRMGKKRDCGENSSRQPATAPRERRRRQRGTAYAETGEMEKAKGSALTRSERLNREVQTSVASALLR